MQKKLIVFIFVFFNLFSCGKSKDQELQDAILSANIHLSSSQCQKAIDVLEGHGRNNKSANYLKTLSAAYACRAGFSTVTFFASDLAITATPAPLGGASIYSTSFDSSANPFEYESRFRDMQTAINILLYAGGIDSITEPLVTERAKYFTADEAGEINSQLLYLLLAQLGRYMHVYGNGNAAGVKGGGALSNDCFANYEDTAGAVQVALAALPGACTVTNSAHSQLDEAFVAAATRKRRMCHGVILLNGVFDVLPGVVASAAGGSLAAVSGVTAAITAAKTALTAAVPGIGTVLTTVNQSFCEDDGIVSDTNLENYFALMMEGIFN